MYICSFESERSEKSMGCRLSAAVLVSSYQWKSFRAVGVGYPVDLALFEVSGVCKSRWQKGESPDDGIFTEAMKHPRGPVRLISVPLNLWQASGCLGDEFWRRSHFQFGERAKKTWLLELVNTLQYFEAIAGQIIVEGVVRYVLSERIPISLKVMVYSKNGYQERLSIVYLLKDGHSREQRVLSLRSDLLPLLSQSKSHSSALTDNNHLWNAQDRKYAQVTT